MTKLAKRVPEWLTIDATIILVGAGILIAAAVWL
jgi:hypothetical protein